MIGFLDSETPEGYAPFAAEFGQGLSVGRCLKAKEPRGGLLCVRGLRAKTTLHQWFDRSGAIGVSGRCPIYTSLRTVSSIGLYYAVIEAAFGSGG